MSKFSSPKSLDYRAIRLSFAHCNQSIRMRINPVSGNGRVASYIAEEEFAYAMSACGDIGHRFRIRFVPLIGASGVGLCIPAASASQFANPVLSGPVCKARTGATDSPLQASASWCGVCCGRRKHFGLFQQYPCSISLTQAYVYTLCRIRPTAGGSGQSGLQRRAMSPQISPAKHATRPGGRPSSHSLIRMLIPLRRGYGGDLLCVVRCHPAYFAWDEELS